MFGIFSLLDNECKMPQPKSNNFLDAVNSKHQACEAFSAKNVFRNSIGFTIKHFARDVFYETVRNSQKIFTLFSVFFMLKGLFTLF